MKCVEIEWIDVGETECACNSIYTLRGLSRSRGSAKLKKKERGSAEEGKVRGQI